MIIPSLNSQESYSIVIYDDDQPKTIQLTRGHGIILAANTFHAGWANHSPSYHIFVNAWNSTFSKNEIKESKDASEALLSLGNNLLLRYRFGRASSLVHIIYDDLGQDIGSSGLVVSTVTSPISSGIIHTC